MRDVKSAQDVHPLDSIEVHRKHHLNDVPDTTYPKLIVRDFNDAEIHSPRLHEEEKTDLFPHDIINEALHVPDEEDVITDFLLSVSSSPEKINDSEFHQSPKKDDFEAQNEGKMLSVSSSNFCAENSNTDCVFPQLEHVLEFPNKTEMAGANRVLIDTTAPFESVKAAVSKFGGILDWKAHRLQTLERRKLREQELWQAREEIPIYKKQYEETEASKLSVLKELDSTKRLIEELKLNLERTHTEEQQAKQDDDLAKLRVEELEQGIEDEASIAAKTQLKVARSRQKAAASELRIVKNELEQLKKDYELLVSEKDRAIKNAEVSVSASKDVDKLVEEMMIELIDVKESLGFAHGAHLEVEEKKLFSCADRERVAMDCEKELKDLEEEREGLREKIMLKKDRKKKLDIDLAALVELKSELAAYVETKPGLDTEKERVQKELEEVKGRINKVLLGINSLKTIKVELESDVDKERLEICTVKQRKELMMGLVTSLNENLNESQAEIISLQMKARERGEIMADLPTKLELAGQESDQAKTLAQLAREEWQKQKDDFDQAKAEEKAMENKLIEAKKEIEAAKASEKLALAAIDASKMSENDDGNVDKDVITLSLEEYYVLTKRAHKAQENANTMVASVISQIEIAKESERKLLQKLEEVDLEMVAQKEALVIAIHKAENAKESKISVEQELRILRAENEKRRREYVQVSRNPRLSFENSNVSNSFIDMAHTVLPKNGYSHENDIDIDSGAETKGAKKKKKPFFPRIFMFLARRKAHASKSK